MEPNGSLWIALSKPPYFVSIFREHLGISYSSQMMQAYGSQIDNCAKMKRRRRSWSDLLTVTSTVLWWGMLSRTEYQSLIQSSVLAIENESERVSYDLGLISLFCLILRS